MNDSMKTCAALSLIVFALSAACGKDGVAVDNTQVNERDKGNTVTPMDQGNGEADLSTTQKIRQLVMADDALSSDAKNAKIITANGVVMLRGPVKSDVERANIEAKARQLAGTNRVENHLDVEATK